MERNDGKTFEVEVMQLVRAMGFDAIATKASGDGGVDVVAYNQQPLTRGKYVIQCKDWTDPVGEPVVRDLYGTMMSEGANKGILITRSVFTSKATQFAADKPLELIDGVAYMRLCEEAKIETLDDSSSISIPRGYLRLIGFTVENKTVSSDTRRQVEDFREHIGSVGTLIINKDHISFGGKTSSFIKSLKPHNHSITAVSVDVGPSDIVEGKKYPDPGNAIVGVRYRKNWLVEGENEPLSMWMFFEGEPDTVGQSYADAQKQMGTNATEKQCFVATAVYHDNNCKQVEALRQWRDHRLRKSVLGRQFIGYYYQHGPVMAAYVSQRTCLKVGIRICLDLFTKMLRYSGRVAR